MKHKIVPIAALLCACHLVACRNQSGEATQSVVVGQEEVLSRRPYHGDDFVRQVVTKLHGRRSWATVSVKLPLNSPKIHVYTVIDGEKYDLFAWPGTQNDFNVPMARLGSSSKLYELTEHEYEVLGSKYAQNP